MSTQHVYFFGFPEAEGAAAMKNLLGGKGANLAEMTNLGLPVPAGFTITTEVCTQFDKSGGVYPDGLKDEVEQNIRKVEKSMRLSGLEAGWDEAHAGRGFGDSERPLLMSVRSGARVSMPGMMDTVLNIGLNDESIKGLIAWSGNERFAYDAYRRFVQMYSDVVMGMDHHVLESMLTAKKKAMGVESDTELTAENLRDLVAELKAKVKETLGQEVPTDPMEQLWGAIGAVFQSWETPRAVAYRQMNGIPDDWGTAVNVQSMVFGNIRGEDCATGVAFTRDPSTGARRFYGEYLPNAQGEDVVAGIRTPHPLTDEQRQPGDATSLESKHPENYKELERIYHNLEAHYRDMQDIEFTIELDKLWMLQTRNGKRTGQAAVRIAVEMTRPEPEDIGLTHEEALMQVPPESLVHLLAPVFSHEEKQTVIDDGGLLSSKGLPAGPGAASGPIVFTAEEAVLLAEQVEAQGKSRGKADPDLSYPILVRVETSPDDVAGMKAAVGILTARGGMTSHAAVVARGMGKSCVAGCGDLDIDYQEELLKVGDRTYRKGDWISIDGSTGEVIGQRMETHPSEILQVMRGELAPESSLLFQNFSQLMAWADDARGNFGVRTNADQPEDAEMARLLGAQGIGLCRTEHMFFDEERIPVMQEMILADDVEAREASLAKLLPFQRADFEGIFRAMDGLPVTVRLLDPPLHEFLPHTQEDQRRLAEEMGLQVEAVHAKVEELAEVNPMLGHRGCRLGITYPEITAMQARAIFLAAVTVQDEGLTVLPEVMIPLVSHVNELRLQRELVDRVAREVMEETGKEIAYLVGTMIELPRACVTAAAIAEMAEFFSFGTNDLTQTAFGFSRDDAGKFLKDYVGKGVLKQDPFVALDQDGVGELVKLGVKLGRTTRRNLKVGICGEHGGEPTSVEFCYRIGLNYVSCSPYRVPVARLAGAQAKLKKAPRG